MQQTHSSTATMFPFARYEDAAAAIDWLVDAFGFEKREVTPGPNGTIRHAELGHGASVFMLSSPQNQGLGVQTVAKLGSATGGVYVQVDDVDAHYEHAKGAGAEIVMELTETDYGSREYVARDLEGNVWGFGTYRPGG